jgi:hypothetical protein
MSHASPPCTPPSTRMSSSRKPLRPAVGISRHIRSTKERPHHKTSYPALFPPDGEAARRGIRLPGRAGCAHQGTSRHQRNSRGRKRKVALHMLVAQVAQPPTEQNRAKMLSGIPRGKGVRISKLIPRGSPERGVSRSRQSRQAHIISLFKHPIPRTMHEGTRRPSASPFENTPSGRAKRAGESFEMWAIVRNGPSRNSGFDQRQPDLPGSLFDFSDHAGL